MYSDQREQRRLEAMLMQCSDSREHRYSPSELEDALNEENPEGIAG